METSSHTPRRYTLEQYMALDDADDARSDLVRGLLVREPRPGFVHGIVQVEVARVLSNHVRRGPGGFVVTESGVVLAQNPPTVRGPDVAYYSAGRFPEGLPRPFAEAPPDLAVEILSPSDTASRFQEKVMDYLEAGVRMIWTLDPERRSAVVYGAGGDVRLLKGDDMLDGGDALPGFRLPLGDLFPF